MRNRGQSLASGLGLLALTLFLLGSGIYFMLEAKTLSVMWLYYSHIAGSTLFLAVYLVHRLAVRGERARLWFGFY